MDINIYIYIYIYIYIQMCVYILTLGMRAGSDGNVLGLGGVIILRNNMYDCSCFF